MKHKKHDNEADTTAAPPEETARLDASIEDSESDALRDGDVVDMITEPEDGTAIAAACEKALRERDALQDQVLRARAEFENFRKRMMRDQERIRKTAAEGLMRDLLPVVDHLELALQHAEGEPAALREGVELVLKQFTDVLTRHGVTPIPAVGEVFDPNHHEAVMQESSADVPEMTVVREFQRGYRLGDQVLRASKVVVNMGAPCEASPAE